LTGNKVVSRIFSNLAIIDVTPEGFRVHALAPGITFDEVCEKTDAPLLPIKEN